MEFDAEVAVIGRGVDGGVAGVVADDRDVVGQEVRASDLPLTGAAVFLDDEQPGDWRF